MTILPGRANSKEISAWYELILSVWILSDVKYVVSTHADVVVISLVQE